MRPLLFACTLALLCLSGCSSGPVQLLSVTGVTPDSIAAGSAVAQVTVTGQQFNRNMSIKLNATVLPTAFLSGQKLQASLPAAILNTGGDYAVSILDDEGAQGGAATLATTFTVHVVNGAPGASTVSPSVTVSGQPGATVVISGSNLLPSTTATVAGASRTLTFQDNSHAAVQLTADDLLYARQLSIVLTNPSPGGGSSAPLTLQVTNYSKPGTAYHAYGDSITYGYGVNPPDLPFAYLLAKAEGLPILDQGGTGDQACDAFAHIAKTQDGYKASAGVVYSFMIGTNDTYVKGTGSYEAVFNNCDLAAMSWLALPRANKLLAGDSGLIGIGGCGGTPDTGRYGVLYCSNAGSITVTYVTEGAPMYVWYLLDDSAAASSGFQLSIDGQHVETYSTASVPAIATQNKGTSSIGVARIPVSAGAHTVSLVTSTGQIGLLGLGSVPASHKSLTFVAVGDVPNQELSQPRASAATQLQYTADVRGNVALLQADGLDVRYIPTRNYMLGTHEEMTDQIHPDALGYQHLFTAFQPAFLGLNSSTGPVALERSGEGCCR